MVIAGLVTQVGLISLTKMVKIIGVNSLIMIISNIQQTDTPFGMI